MTCRISAQQVKEAYKETQLMPLRSAFTSYYGGPKQACALTAIAISKKLTTFEELYSEETYEFFIEEVEQMLNRLSDELSLSSEYINGFITGWDASEEQATDPTEVLAEPNPFLEEAVPDFRQGYIDGQAAAEGTLVIRVP